MTINNFMKSAFHYFMQQGMTAAGAAGLCGNLYAESAGFYSNRVEFLCIKRLKENGKSYTDTTYTDAVDKKKISKSEFLNPLPGRQYGYGLAQWTYPSRKKGLYERTVEKGLSIADEAAQLEFIVYELKTLYSALYELLQASNDVDECSDEVLKRYENPADWKSYSYARETYAKEIYNALATDTTTEVDVRQKPIDWLKKYVGIKEGSAGHKEILSVFNNSGLCKRYTMTIYDAWCATAVSAAFIATGLAGNPGTGAVFECVECYCESVIQKAISQGIWKENDGYVPTKGDIILYDWDDTGVGDDTGLSDHIGIVTACNGKTITVIEGNINDTVGYRNISVNGRYIRGFITPNYGTKTVSTSATVSAEPYIVKVMCDELNIRSGAGTSFEIVGCIKDEGCYTIVETTPNNWGKLKSGYGWICLDYTKRI